MYPGKQRVVERRVGAALGTAGDAGEEDAGGGGDHARPEEEEEPHEARPPGLCAPLSRSQLIVWGNGYQKKDGGRKSGKEAGVRVRGGDRQSLSGTEVNPPNPNAIFNSTPAMSFVGA